MFRVFFTMRMETSVTCYSKNQDLNLGPLTQGFVPKLDLLSWPLLQSGFPSLSTALWPMVACCGSCPVHRCFNSIPGLDPLDALALLPQHIWL